ncbi:MAG: sigma-70 family RNA polymerase sigma factor, partial [Oscillospiraceae bacterium]|nr:sigma-70 family RNA polymerase sigma factor [Oscillospiraceae bacterium]
MTAGTLDLLALARQGDEAATAQVLEENSGLIWAVVRRYFGKGVEPDDLYQLGCLGFIKAVRGFDASYGTQFSTYAVPKIAGEIRRYLRDNGLIKVGRGLRERS